MSDQITEQMIRTVLDCLQNRVKHLLAVYVFGSFASNLAGPQSDIDLAILVDGVVKVTELWDIANELEGKTGRSVDLLDLRQASTVMQHQIVTHGKCVWKKDSEAALYESFILSEYTELNTARAPLLADIEKDGRVYGR